MNLNSPYVFIPALSILMLLGGLTGRPRPQLGADRDLIGAFGILGSLFYHVSKAIG